MMIISRGFWGVFKQLGWVSVAQAFVPGGGGASRCSMKRVKPPSLRMHLSRIE